MIDYDYCYTTNSFKLNFKADGTLNFEVESTDDTVDYDTSSTQCEVVKKEENIVDKAKGNWAYNSDTKKLIIVIYEETSITDGGTPDVDKYDAGDAEVFEVAVNFEDGNLVIVDSDNDEDYSYSSYFKKQ